MPAAIARTNVCQFDTANPLPYGNCQIIHTYLAIIIMSDPQLAPVIAITNHKGGVGKTTVCVNLAAELGRRGHNVLVIDLDPQANASGHIGVAHPASVTINASSLFNGDIASITNAIQTSMNPGFFNIHLIPSSLSLDQIEDYLRIHSPRPYEEMARRIGALRMAYDIILIDCPPRLGLLSGNAIAAASHYIIPLETNSQYPLHGVTDLTAFIEKMSAALNPSLVRIGVLLTRHDERKRACRAIEESARLLAGPVLPVVIHSSTKVAEASVMRAPIRRTERDGRVTKDFEALCAHIVGLLDLQQRGDSQVS